MQDNFLRNAAIVAASSAIAFAPTSPVLAAHHLMRAASANAVASVPRFETSVFARGTSTLFNPDGIVVTKHYVFVAYQNLSDTSNAPSTLVKYDRRGRMLGSVNLNGRLEGLRLNPYTHEIWSLVNNDGLNGTPPRQPALYVVDPKSLATRPYAFGTTQPHGGGYDDLAFVNGRAFISASAPTLTAAGLNPNPALVEVTLVGSRAEIKPAVFGNTVGYDIVSKKTMQLNIGDPDSLAVDAQGDLVVVSEGDSQLFVVRNVGQKDQAVLRLAVGTQLDEVAATRGTFGTLFVADDAHNVIYSIEARFPIGTNFVEAAQGAPTQSFVGTVDPASGTLTPLLTVRDGIVDPTSLIFVQPGAEADD